MTALEKVAEMKAVAEVEVQKFADLAEAIVAGEAAAYTKGFDEGIGQSTSPGDKIYSEEELQAELAPLKSEIEALKTSVTGLEAQVAAFPEQMVAAVDAKVAEVMVDFESTQIDDEAFKAKYKK